MKAETDFSFKLAKATKEIIEAEKKRRQQKSVAKGQAMRISHCTAAKKRLVSYLRNACACFFLNNFYLLDINEEKASEFSFHKIFFEKIFFAQLMAKIRSKKF